MNFRTENKGNKGYFQMFNFEKIIYLFQNPWLNLSISQAEYYKIQNAMLQLPIFRINIFILCICFAQAASGQKSSITVETREILTYPFSDPIPVPVLTEKKSELSPYFTWGQFFEERGTDTTNNKYSRILNEMQKIGIK